MAVKMYECDHCGWQNSDMDAMLVHLGDKHGVKDLTLEALLDPDSADVHVVDASLRDEIAARQAEGD